MVAQRGSSDEPMDVVVQRKRRKERMMLDTQNGTEGAFGTLNVSVQRRVSGHHSRRSHEYFRCTGIRFDWGHCRQSLKEVEACFYPRRAFCTVVTLEVTPIIITGHKVTPDCLRVTIAVAVCCCAPSDRRATISSLVDRMLTEGTNNKRKNVLGRDDWGRATIPSGAGPGWRQRLTPSVL